MTIGLTPADLSLGRRAGDCADCSQDARLVRSASAGLPFPPPVSQLPDGLPLRRCASADLRPPQCRVPLPALQDLLDPQEARRLDERFGSLQPVRPGRADGHGLRACELDGEGRPLLHPRVLALPDPCGATIDLTGEVAAAVVDLAALRSGRQRAIWCVNAAGQLRLAEEIDLGPDPVTGGPRYMGHPTLVRGRPARISGEFNHNPQTGRFRINDVSNAYSRYVDRRPEHLQAVADLFGRGGLHVEAEFHGHKNTAPLAAAPAARARSKNSQALSATAGPRR